MASKETALLALKLSPEGRNEILGMAGDLKKADQAADELDDALERIGRDGDAAFSKLSPKVRNLARQMNAAQKQASRLKGVMGALSNAGGIGGAIAGGLAGGGIGAALTAGISGIFEEVKSQIAKAAEDARGDQAEGRTLNRVLGGSFQSTLGAGIAGDVRRGFQAFTSTGAATGGGADLAPDMLRQAEILAEDFGKLEGSAEDVTAALTGITVLLHTLEQTIGLTPEEARRTITEVSGRTGSDIETAGAAILRGSKQLGVEFSQAELSAAATKAASTFTDAADKTTVLGDAFNSLLPKMSSFESSIVEMTTISTESSRILASAVPIMRQILEGGTLAGSPVRTGDAAKNEFELLAKEQRNHEAELHLIRMDNARTLAQTIEDNEAARRRFSTFLIEPSGANLATESNY